MKIAVRFPGGSAALPLGFDEVSWDSLQDAAEDADALVLDFGLLRRPGVFSVADAETNEFAWLQAVIGWLQAVAFRAIQGVGKVRVVILWPDQAIGVETAVGGAMLGRALPALSRSMAREYGAANMAIFMVVYEQHDENKAVLHQVIADLLGSPAAAGMSGEVISVGNVLMGQRF